jgi:hypothetical protein
MDPVKVKRDDLLVLWTVREAQNENGEPLEGSLQVRGRVYYKDDPLRPKPRMLAEIFVPKEVVDEQHLTMEQVLDFAEERMQLDIHEIAATGPFARPDNKPGEGIDQLRECMAR